MRYLLLLGSTGFLFAQQPVLYNRGTVNSASFAPPGLPNAPIARGSVFTVFGENLGPAQTPALAFPLSTVLGGVSLSVTQGAVTTQAFPIYVSAAQVNAVMPSTMTTGLATLRLTYQNLRSNAITIGIADSAPGIFAVSSSGYGPGVVQNFISSTSQPVNSALVPASPGQVITIWGTGLGPVTFPDNVAPTAGNVAAPVSVTIGGRTATVAYSGRSPCCSGVDQVVATVPANAPLGCWVPVSINAGGVVSNTTTMAIAAPGAASCDDPGNPLSKLVRTPGTQAYIDLEQTDSVENVNASPAAARTLYKLYTRFYTRPDSPFNFDPYSSYPPAGACLVHQATGDAYYEKTLRGALPAGASLAKQPTQVYNNGAQALTFTPAGSYFSSTLGGTIDGEPFDMNHLGANESFTIDPAGANQVLNFTIAPPPGWARPDGILVIQRSVPLALTFTPGDAAEPTAVVLYAYSTAYNATVEVQCLAPPGATTFTIPADALANLPTSFTRIDGSYANLAIGTLGVNKAVSFTNNFAASGILLDSSWLSQSVVIQ